MARDKASFVLSSADLISVNILTILLLLLKENVFFKLIYMKCNNVISRQFLEVGQNPNLTPNSIGYQYFYKQ